MNQEKQDIQTPLEKIAFKLFPDKSYWIGSGNSARLYDPNYRDREMWVKGVKWQQERSFTLEQISELFIGDKGGYFDEFLDYRLGLVGNQKKNKIPFKEWFEQFKKNKSYENQDL